MVGLVIARIPEARLPGDSFRATRTQRIEGQAFRRSGVPAFRCSGVRAFRRSGFSAAARAGCVQRGFALARGGPVRAGRLLAGTGLTILLPGGRVGPFSQEEAMSTTYL